MKLIYSKEHKEIIDKYRKAFSDIFEQLFKAYLDQIPLYDEGRQYKARRLALSDPNYQAWMDKFVQLTSNITPKYYFYENATQDKPCGDR